MPGGFCCVIGTCCPPGAQAAALAAHEEIPPDAAVKIVAGYQLVPRTIETGPEPVTEEHVRSAKQRLERLHRRAVTELKSILLDMGHSEKGG